MAVTVYTSPDCMPCRGTKRALDKARIPYTAVDVAEDPSAVETLRGLGYTQTPVVTVELPDGLDHWSGHRPDRIKALEYLAAAGE
ncbi:ribonucleoside-diphosphate reductase class Ib glutaredoxin subunit [Rhodococcus sp. AG1013]|uniref:glutaredoxin domain-containing protein n=1 Tax=Rhodococcus sp. AG1013 TaxID=2183996 RepID=UPI000E0BBC05|nr:glutaredoxin domain-containing protein [Rhodococcus sp. AG1013]RDI32448.1 ribonucleoside-diphosphate reductase class Ib glutaredoxin subunit [Rhodococcus sp. AG1013]